MKTLPSSRYTFAALPKDYGELCRNILLPRPIRDRSHHRETLSRESQLTPAHIVALSRPLPA